MPAHKKYGPLEDKLKQAVAAEIAYLEKKGKSPEQARAILLDMKAKQQLSLRAMKDGTTFRLLKSTKAEQLFREALSDAQPLLNKVTDKSGVWYARVLKALPEKAKEHGTKRKLGEMTAYAASFSAEGSAAETEQQLEGIFGVFSKENTAPLLLAMTAITSGNTKFKNECVGNFSEKEKDEIASQVMLGRNERVDKVQDDNQPKNAVTAGMDPRAFVKRYGSQRGLAKLEEKARAEARANATGRTSDKNSIHAAGSLIWATAAKSITDFLNIKRALGHSKCCAQKDKNGKWRVLVCGEKEMERWRCVGVTIQNDFDYDDCKTELRNCEYTFVELWAIDDTPLVIDCDAKQNSTRVKDPLYKRVKLDKNRYVKPVAITDQKGQPLKTFRLSVGLNSETKITHHRLVAIYIYHYGFDFSQHPLIMKYLDLKEGQSFEEHERFKYRQDLSDIAMRNRFKREEHLERRQWHERKLAKWSDFDHLLGRSKKWKNSYLFGMNVSHSWNRAMAYIRIVYGDWLYGFANVKYESGND